MRAALAAVAAAAVLSGLAACGGSPSGPPSIASAARQAGCTNVRDYYTGEMFTHASAMCTLNGQEVEIAVFVSSNEQHAWEQAVSAFGKVVKDGPLWAVSES